jgi:hypothetical protein
VRCANDLIGTEADLNRNPLDLLAAAGLTEDEIREFGRLQRDRINRYSRRSG